jgi:hypothetical protein
MLRTLLTLFIFSFATALFAQDTLQSPSAFLGYALGSRYTAHHRVVDYARYVASKAPATARLYEYGRTYEGRPLLTVTFSSASNMSRIEEIRTDHLKRAQLLEGSASSAAAPAIVWMSYNVHGDEASGTEAALQVMYELANPRNTRTQALLNDAVVIIDPCINPDGRDRFASLSLTRNTPGVAPDAHPDALQHSQVWPSNRTNHYYFDLNRDWVWQTQVESQQRVRYYHTWMPHVHADFHEMGPNSPYFFLPGAEPQHELISPWQREFQQVLGKLNASYFDRAGRLYYTKETYDLLAPNFGDTYPMFNGAIGMTYEQGGADGAAYRTRIGDTLTLALRVSNHVTTSMATIEASVQQRDRHNREFDAYFNRSINSPTGTYKTFVISGDNLRGKLDEFTAFLRRNGIQYGYAKGPSTGLAPTGFSYSANKVEGFAVKAGDVVVSAYQPRSVLAQVMLEPRTTITDTLTYDMTAWALPYVYGLKAYASTQRLTVATIDQAPQVTVPTLPEQPYGYLIPYQSLRDLRGLVDLLKQGLRVRSAARSITVAGATYPAGTLLLVRGEHAKLGARFDQIVRSVVASHNLTLFTLPSGQVERGPDLGSGWINVLKAPRVAVAAGPGVYETSLGAVWYYFEQEIKYPLTVLRADQLRRARLSDFDVIILPDGNYGSALGESTLEALNLWMESGGRLIAIEGAARSFAGREKFALRAREVDTAQAKLATNPELLPKYDNRERDEVKESVAGAIFQIKLDATYPLAFGLSNPYYTLKVSPNAYGYLRSGWNVGWIEAKGPISGFAGARARKRLESGLLFGVEEHGRGSITYLADDPLFRCIWYSGKHLFGNAVFQVPSN